MVRTHHAGGGEGGALGQGRTAFVFEAGDEGRGLQDRDDVTGNAGARRPVPHGRGLPVSIDVGWRCQGVFGESGIFAARMSQA